MIPHSIDEIIPVLIQLSARLAALDGMAPVLSVPEPPAPDSELAQRLAEIEARVQDVRMIPAAFDPTPWEARLRALEERPIMTPLAPGEISEATPGPDLQQLLDRLAGMLEQTVEAHNGLTDQVRRMAERLHHVEMAEHSHDLSALLTPEQTADLAEKIIMEIRRRAA